MRFGSLPFGGEWAQTPQRQGIFGPVSRNEARTASAEPRDRCSRHCAMLPRASMVEPAGLGPRAPARSVNGGDLCRA